MIDTRRILYRCVMPMLAGRVTTVPATTLNDASLSFPHLLTDFAKACEGAQ